MDTFLGEELQCGRHGYSARDNGFRFDIEVGTSERRMSEEKIKIAAIVQSSLEKEKNSRENVEKIITLGESDNSVADAEVISRPDDENCVEELSENILKEDGKVITNDSQEIGIPQRAEKGDGGGEDPGSPPLSLPPSQSQVPSLPPTSTPTVTPIPTHPPSQIPSLPPAPTPAVTPIIIPIPTHPHAGDPLLVEDPGNDKLRGIA